MRRDGESGTYTGTKEEIGNRKAGRNAMKFIGKTGMKSKQAERGETSIKTERQKGI